MRRERPPADADGPAPAELPPSLTPVQAPRRDGRLGQSLGVVVALVLLAIAKPWGPAAPEPSSAPRLPQPAPLPSEAPAATEDRSADGLAGPICLGAGAWRVASLESWRTQDVRVWRAIEPVVSASGPLDRSIPSVPVVAVRVTALGWCAPSFGAARPVGPAGVGAWLVSDGLAEPVILVQVQPGNGSTPLAALYLPLAACVAGSSCPLPSARAAAGWPAGRVVFRWEDIGTGTTAWFAAEIDLTAPPGPRTSPGETAGAAG